MVRALYEPDQEAMRQHAEHLFGGDLGAYRDGKIELAWTDNRPDSSGRYRLKNARLFSVDQIDELVREAAHLNSINNCNVYIGAALRKPDAAPFGRAQDNDAYALTCTYVDLDDPGAALAAKNIYGPDKPTFIVLTGRAPHVRAQMWWRLEEPIGNTQWWPGLLRGICAKLGGDSTVVNPSRVMRLAGSIAWPVKPGRTVELTSVAPLREPGPDYYSVDHLAGVFSPLASKAPITDTPSPKKELLGMAVQRGEFFRRVNDRALSNLDKWVPAIFGADAYYQSGTGAWRVPSRSLGRNLEEDLSLAPTGIVDFGVHDMGDARQGKRTPIDILLEYGHAPFARDAAFMLCELTGVSPSDIGWESHPADRQTPVPEQIESKVDKATDIYETLSLSEIDTLPPPTWLIEDMIPEHGLTFIYGKPGKGKSFIALDLALRIAHGFDWHGKPCKQGGVLYIAGEGRGGYRNRVHGWHSHHGLVPDCAPFRLLPRTVNFMNADEVAKLIRTVKSVVGDAILVIVDTVARVLPGAEENASKEMGLFVAACDAIKDTCNVSVIGIHHSGKDEDRGMRGSTALEGAGDAILHLKRKDDSKIVEVVTEKQKDGEEAKPLYLKLDKIEWMDGLKQASTLVPEVADTAPDQQHWPDRDTCRRILNAIEEAWVSGKPWSFEPQSKRSGRYAPAIMGTSFHLSAKLAESMIETWLMNDVLSVEMRNSDTKRKGLKVIGAV